MGLTDRTLLHDPSAPRVNVEPVVLFNIVDHFSRRDQGQDFVVGTLLGTEENGVVTVSSCFPVPHTETEEQVAVFVEHWHSAIPQTPTLPSCSTVATIPLTKHATA